MGNHSDLHTLATSERRRVTAKIPTGPEMKCGFDTRGIPVCSRAQRLNDIPKLRRADMKTLNRVTLERYQRNSISALLAFQAASP